MKVALLTTPQARYAEYWRAFLSALGVELAQPRAPYDTWLDAGRASLPGEPLPVQLALGEILSLGTQVDAVLVPAGLPVRDDAWSGAFAELLPQRISGLPTLISVPDEPQALASAAADLGQRLAGNAALVHRAMEQVQPLGQPERREEWPPLQLASHVSVGVVGPRSLLAHPELNAGLWRALGQHGLYPVLAHTLPASQVANRGERLSDPRAQAGDRWLYGAARLLEGKGAVQGLVLVAPAQDAGTRASLQRVAAELHKPVLLLTLDAGHTE
ncbi:MAG: hypothetical protein Q4C67_02220, partial [Deinococcus sp.]|nr:hypothetical protein [Deinococcus sp.]